MSLSPKQSDLWWLATVLFCLFSFCLSVHHWQHTWSPGYQRRSQGCSPSWRKQITQKSVRSTVLFTLPYILYFKSRTQLPGCHTSLMIGWTISCVNPRSTAQYVHWLWSWKWRGGPFPCVTHHVIKSWRNNNHFLHHIKNHTIWLVEFGLKRSQPLLVLCLNTFLQHAFHSMHFSHLLNPLNTIFIYQKINTITILWRKCCDRSNAMVSITRTVFFWKWSLVGG